MLHNTFCRFWEGAEKNSSPSFFIRLGAQRLGIAAGLHGFTPAQLKTYREAVADDKTGTALRRAVDKARAEGFDLSGEHYKRVPKGFDPEHKNADLLRHSALMPGREAPIPEEMFGPKATKCVVQEFKKLVPIQRWLLENVS